MFIRPTHFVGSLAFNCSVAPAAAASWGIIEADRWSAFFQWLNDNNLVETPLDVNAGWTMDYLEA